MNFPIESNSPEMKLAMAIAEDLVIEGFDSSIVLPIAIKLMATIDAAHDDPLIGVETLKIDRRRSDEWWIQYHPNTKIAKQAKKRIK